MVSGSESIRLTSANGPDPWHKRVALSTLVISFIGGVGSISLAIYAGRGNWSILQLALFASWVVSPFAATALLSRRLQHAMLRGQFVFALSCLGIATGSLAIYGNVASAPRVSKLAFPFLVVPFLSWLGILTIIPLTALLFRPLSTWRLLRWLIKAAAAAILFLILGIGSLLGLLVFDHNRETLLPAPTGSYAVGRATFVWGNAPPDSLRPQDPRRELVVWIWYPAASQPDAQKVEYLPAAWRSAIENLSGVILSQLLTRDLARVQAHSLRDAPVSPQQPTYPVVLLRGGGAAPTTDYTSLAEDLASHGYVVVGFDAPYRSWVVVYPDGRVIPRSNENHLDLVGGPQADALAERLALGWAADCRFVLDRLEQLNKADSNGPLQGRLDLQRVGMFGHSLGGATSLLFTQNDRRCQAGIDVDGAPLGPVIHERVTKPFLFVLSDHRGETASESTPNFIRDAAPNIRSLFDRMPEEHRMMLQIKGANHFLFSDNGALLKSPALMQMLRWLRIVRIDGRRQLVLTAQVVRAFFDVHLKGAPASELKDRLAAPEIEVLQ
jgi:predicted dienelactone hydrolase